MTPYFFGYGSLVNRNTHSYPDARPAQLDGWRRQWVRTEGRDIVYLSVVQHTATRIDGLIAAVPGADWAALDKREYSYERHASGGAVVHDLTPAPDIAHYAIPADIAVTHGDHVILLSYLDVVVQGFLREFGTEGAARFFDTTDGWDTPILDDRAAPLYPRHQTLTEAETAVVDHHMERLSVQIKERAETTFAARNF
ncbi:gamma-glutamylcyclotransferase family protein [Sulfitobacter sp. R18_1]|uniref:gamma-glutamylcyclotransferase family protein n=1 Tax=Sulfitobacter sp. R18_1 TaxID=2821104 RepID=UPI001ADD606C|nr:gamma-glutamylcyclotransferase family protein [Sulfitobacter sp. R18_1]MBO9429372.1 gamma-glutamylcyclotransferase [Sulfitobacter sp. R18_1]